MATVYFTSNASTGAGSLVEAIRNAQPSDVIRPDETVFERGSTIEIVLASTLTVAKNLTLDAAPCRVRLVGGGATGLVFVRSGATAEFVGFDFVGGVNSSTYYHGGGATISENSNAVFNRCLFAGCKTSRSGGAIFVQAGSNAEVRDSLIVGCRAASTSGGLCASGVASVSGSTVVGNVDSTGVNDAGGSGKASFFNSIIGASTVKTSNENVGSVVDVASSSIGFVASPPDDLSVETWNANAWQNWDLRLIDDASPNPSPYRDSGDVDAASKYDLDGNFRGRETNGVATCSPGAYETLQADLFWIGADATGTEVVLPSFLTSNGWATSRFAIVSGDVAPQVGQKLFVDGAVVFDDVLTTANANGQRFALSLGGGANVRFPSATVHLFELQTGAASTFTFSNVRPNEARFGDWSRLAG
ncbi:MAG: hypothetical protein J6K25_13095, partial [Thermoguttaceae bacterium]|nr:hypothetical protein [Thermoguttaceae bacterium]